MCMSVIWQALSVMAVYTICRVYVDVIYLLKFEWELGVWLLLRSDQFNNITAIHVLV